MIYHEKTPALEEIRADQPGSQLGIGAFPLPASAAAVHHVFGAAARGICFRQEL